VQLAGELCEWLAAPDPRILEQWLQGYALAPVPDDEDSYKLLGRAAYLFADAGVSRKRFSERLAEYIDTEPDRRRPGKRANQLLLNLFMLCAVLSQPSELGGALKRVLSRAVVRGDWLGLDLREALETALINNQDNDELVGHWLSMLDGENSSFLPGSIEAGFEGVLLARPSKSRHGGPVWVALSSALSKVVARLSDATDAREQLRRNFLDRLGEAYPGEPWNQFLIELADRDHWPGWAVESLPELLVALPPKGGGRRYLIWKPMLDLLPNDPTPSILRKYCEGLIIEIRARPADVPILDEDAPLMERERQMFPYRASHPDESLALVNNALLLVEQRRTHLHQLRDAREIRTIRERLAFQRLRPSATV
jgi:hypothetical protein